MRRFGKLKTFFIICAAVLVAGGICTVIGVEAGGVEGMQKISEKYEWIQVGAPDEGERGVTTNTVDDFHAVEVDGDADVYLIGEAFYKNATKMVSDEIELPLESTEMDVLGPNKVIVIAGDQVPQPIIEVEDGVLKLSSPPEQDNCTWMPEIVVCCPAETLEAVNVNSEYDDFACLGVSWKNANIKIDRGDVSMEGVESGGLAIKVSSADVEMEGKFLKSTSLDVEYGDVDIDSELARTEYALNLKADAGDITIKEPGSDAAEYDEDSPQVKQPGGPHKLTVMCHSGDMNIEFGGGAE